MWQAPSLCLVQRLPVTGWWDLVMRLPAAGPWEGGLGLVLGHSRAELCSGVGGCAAGGPRSSVDLLVGCEVTAAVMVITFLSLLFP